MNCSLDLAKVLLGKPDLARISRWPPARPEALPNHALDVGNFDLEVGGDLLSREDLGHLEPPRKSERFSPAQFAARVAFTKDHVCLPVSRRLTVELLRCNSLANSPEVSCLRAICALISPANTPFNELMAQP